MNLKFFKVYLRIVVILSCLAIIPYFLLSEETEYKDAAAGWAFSMYLLIYLISVIIAYKISGIKIIEGKKPKIISLVFLVFSFLLMLTVVVISGSFAIVPAILVLLSTVSFCICLILLASYIIRLIKNRQELPSDHVSIGYQVFFALTSFFVIYNYWLYVSPNSYPHEYSYYPSLAKYLAMALPLMTLATLLVAIIIVLVKLSWQNKTRVTAIAAAIFSLFILGGTCILYTKLFTNMADDCFGVYNDGPNDYYYGSYDNIDSSTTTYTNANDDYYESPPYVREVHIPEGIKARHFEFIANNTKQEEDSVKLAIENYSLSYSSVSFPPEGFDYWEKNPDRKKIWNSNYSWSPGEMTQVRIMGFLRFNREAEALWGLFLQYKNLIYKLIPYSKYKEYKADEDVVMLLQAYKDLASSEESFEHIYDAMSNDEYSDKRKLRELQTYVTKESSELATELHRGDTWNYILAYSFWGRRWKEGNIDVCYSILSDIHEHYKKAAKEQK